MNNTLGLESAGRTITPSISDQGLNGTFLVCEVDQLEPHPALVRLGIVPNARELSRSSGTDDLLTISHNGYILDGYSSWICAQDRRERNISCLRLELTEEEAIVCILRKHQRSSKINDFNRILLALELEPVFKKQAKANQQWGGRLKHTSNLTEDERVDVRDRIAAVADVSVANVSAVKALMHKSSPELKQALRDGEISIHRAYRWLKESSDPVSELARFRDLRGITRAITTLQRRHSKSQRGSRGFDVCRLGAALMKTETARAGHILIAEVRAEGRVLLLSKELREFLERQADLFS